MLRRAEKRVGPMIFWSIAIAVTAVACAALFYAAAGRTVNAGGPDPANANSHFRQLLAGIEADLAAGKLGEPEALAAKGELAREMLRARAESREDMPGGLARSTLVLGLVAVIAISFGLYAVLGSPNLPGQPLAGRPDAQAQSMDLGAAIARIEAALAANPGDLRGWTVIAPAYVEEGRYGDAVNAYRRILALGGPAAETQTDLAEALLLDAGGQGSAEAMDLLRAAAARDPAHARSRLYLGAELTRTGQYGEAARYWQEAIDLAQGDEPWLPAARQGLAVAQNDGVDDEAANQQAMIAQMVTGLAERLDRQGGTVEEWTQLVRAYLVLGDTARAQAAYDSAIAAYPAAFDRGEMDSLALDGGLVLNGEKP